MGFIERGCGYLPFLRRNIFILPVITAAVQQRGQFWQQLLPLFCRQRFALGVAERRGGDNFRSRNGAERVVIVGIAFSHQRICAARALLKLINLQKHRAAARAGERFTLAVKGNFDTIIMLQRLNQGGGLAAVEAKMAVVFGLQRTAIPLSISRLTVASREYHDRSGRRSPERLRAVRRPHYGSTGR